MFFRLKILLYLCVNTCMQVVDIVMGEEVEVEGKGKGIVRYIGTTDFYPNETLFGIELEEPIGTHNGTFKDKTYFETSENCGIFAKRQDIYKVSEKVCMFVHSFCLFYSACDTCNVYFIFVGFFLLLLLSIMC